MTRECYTYQPLNPQLDEVRFLQVLPSATSGLLRCRIIQASLNSTAYEALSYVWGNEEAVHVLYINNKVFHIRENLMLALQNFRSKWRTRTLWVDAICINQRDELERSQQVRKMRRIYEQALRVLVWLGAEGEDKRVMRYLGFLAYFQFIRTALRAYHDDQLSSVQVDFDLFNQFLTRPWFQRVWVVQEVTANEEAVVYCGSFTMKWPQFIAAVRSALQLFTILKSTFSDDGEQDQKRAMMETYSDIKNTATSAGTYAFGIEEFRISKVKKRQIRLEETLEHMRGLGATIPKDRVYASLGISPLAGIIPDYSAEDNAVYWQTAERIITESQSLNILRYCQPNGNAGLPSWAPDWSQTRTAALLPVTGVGHRTQGYRASTETLAIFSLETGSRNLSARGVMVDVIDNIHREPGERNINWQRAALACSTGIFAEDMEYRVIQHDVKLSAEEKALRTGRYQSGGSVGDAFAMTLLCARFHDPDGDWMKLTDTNGQVIVSESIHLVNRLGGAEQVAKEVTFSIQDLISGFKPPRDGREPQVPTVKNWIKFLASILEGSGYLARRAQGKRFIVTKRSRYMGLCNTHTEPGDVVVVLEGMEVPLILRKMVDQDSYTVVGEAYIHGIMENGEAFSNNDVEIRTFELI